jgi:histidinol-phosphate/aromatic aminotransferase/cobyric acid decarboxylase-like protein/choline kinase
MWPVSDGRHKGLLEVDGQSVVSRMVGDLAAIGVTSITVVTGHDHAELEAHLREQPCDAELRFLHNARYRESNNIVSLLLALNGDLSQQDVIVVDCDVVLAPGALGRLAQRTGQNVALVDRYATGMHGTVARTDGGRIAQLVLVAGQHEGFDYHDVQKTLNVYRFSAGFCDAVLRPLLEARVRAGACDVFYESVLADLGDLRSYAIVAEHVDREDWAELDTPADLPAARFAFEPDARAEILDRAHGGHWTLPHRDHALLRNVHFPPPALVAALRHALPDLIYSYGSAQEVVDEKLAAFLHCAPDDVIALNGGSDACPLLRRAFAGRSVAIPTPTFDEYARALPHASRYRDAPGVDAAELDLVAAAHDVLVIVSPNNPTTTTIATADIVALAERHRDTTLLVDESFIAFSDQPSLLAAVRPLPANVLVLASLSKTLGMPGVRLGYLAGGDLELLASLRAELAIWQLNSVAEHVLELLPRFRPALAASLQRSKRDRETLAALLAELDMVAEVHAGGGNFVLARLDGAADSAARIRHALLASDRINVKDVTPEFDDGAPRLRIGVRSDADNRQLVEALSRCPQLAPA